MTSKIDTVIREAAEGMREGLEMQVRARILNGFEKAVEAFGPALRGAGNAWGTSGHFYRQTLRGLLKISDGIYDANAPKELDAEKVDRAVREHVAGTIEAVALKLAEKLGELDDATLTGEGFGHFILRGTRAGRSVRIEQKMILNVSPKGRLFNQWPARITLDGKATSAAAYARAFA